MASVIRHLTTSVLKRLLAAAGLAPVSEVAHERRAASAIRKAERARAGRDADAASVRIKELDDKLRLAHQRLAAEHADSNSLVGILRHYLVRLGRTEAELAERAAAARTLRRAQLAIGAKSAARRGLSPEAARHAEHFASASAQYSATAALWRGGKAPAGVRSVSNGRLNWSVPPEATDAASLQLLDSGELPLDDLAAIREFAVGGVMLDIGANIGLTSVPRILLGDFTRVYAAEPNLAKYRCLVGNVLNNHCEGRVLPDLIAVGGSSPTVRIPAVHDGGEIADVPCVTLDEWVRRLGVAADDVRFVRIALQHWNLDLVRGAAHLLKRRHIVWQIEAAPEFLRSAETDVPHVAARIAAHFTNVKELGRYWSGPWRPASETRRIVGSLGGQRRSANLILFNLRGESATRQSVIEAPEVIEERIGEEPTISLLHCTARLPNGWRPAMEAFLSNAKKPEKVEYILAIDEDQEFSLPANQLARWGSCALVKDGVTSLVSGYNAAARAARGDILVTIADDYFPPPSWDEAIRQAIPNVSQEVVLDVDNSDGSTWLLPFCMVTRKYYERYGYLFYPGYRGLCADNEFTEQARRDGVVKSVRYIVFDHRHPDRGLAPMDEVYVRHKSQYEQAKQIFNARREKNFPKWPD